FGFSANEQTTVKNPTKCEKLSSDLVETLSRQVLLDFDEICSPRTRRIEVRQFTYSVPARLIGQQLKVHLRHDRSDLSLPSHYVVTLPRLHAHKGQQAPRRIDFRHVIDSLRSKPRTLMRAQLQHDLRLGESWRLCRRMRLPR
ncbi:MAG: hypothetical protein ACKO3F_08185, partial [Cyanobium sp.]